jgi:hypothetical protein
MARPLRTLSFAFCALAAASAASAEVVKLTVEHRQPFANAKLPYEKLTGRFTGELDPKLPQNALITDIELAPRNARGMVEYSATFTILKPVDMSKATGVLVYQVPNRGRANIEGAGYFADFRASGHVLVASGWQGDIAPLAGLETMVAPVARHHDGSSITGPVMARFSDAPAGANTQPIIRGRVAGTATPASLDTTKATLTRRLSEEGARVPIAPSAWAFADCTQTAFPGTPDPAKLCLEEGFDPASLYELTYTAKDPYVLGVGMACAVTALPILVLLFLLGTPFIALWIGPEYAARGRPVLWLLAGSTLVESLQPLLWRFFIGVGQLGVLVRVSALTSGLVILIGIALVVPLGIAGVAAGVLIGSLISQLVFARHACRFLEIGGWALFRCVHLRPLAAGVLLFALGWWLVRGIGAETFPTLLACGGATVVAYLPLAWYVALDSGERQWVLERLSRLRRTRRHVSG